MAYLFVDYMAAQAITIRLESKDNQQVDLYLDDETQLAFVQQALKSFIENPDDPRYREVSWQIGKLQQHNLTSTSLLNIRHTGIITTSVAVLCIILFLIERVAGPQAVLAYFGFPVGGNMSGQLWRWLTPIFLHFSLLHILFNLCWWWYLGGMVEQRLGKVTLLEITLLAGLISNYSEAILVGSAFGGLSGVIYALMGYAWLMGEFKSQSGIYLERGLLLIAIIWLIAGFSGYLGPIANIAHLSGLIVGLLIAAKDIMFKLK
ncbi:rhomboid family intramembrane serine protease GlpG [Utexia brackfieldae]|uniref:rhomboid family intramembrane serine protease GlpG n=1 Tax=Utexia brackfieldae TaxID=3074108 RepID=UPI00370D41F7